MIVHKCGGCCQDPHRNTELFDEFPSLQQLFGDSWNPGFKPSGLLIFFFSKSIINANLWVKSETRGVYIDFLALWGTKNMS